MSVSRHRISLGALAVVLCLAFPMGVLSLLAPATTGDQVDAAHSILVARVEAMQVLPQDNITQLELDVDHVVAGAGGRRQLSLVVEGRPAVEVGDDILAILETNPDAVLGVYQIEKNQESLQYQVVSSVSGMWSEGISDFPPVSLSRLELAIKVRRGMLDAGVLNQPEGGGDGDKSLNIVDPDDAEPNNTLATAQPIFLDPPHLITGTPLCITGLTLTPNDVDFFSFTGAALSILHVETRPPNGLTFVPPRLTDLDTLLGLFDAGGTLLGFDDDGGLGKFSRFSTPLELNTGYAVAVESAPDPEMDFAFPSNGTTTGTYDLKLELEKAAYLTNFNQLIVGVSSDGTFLEDFIGFKQIGGQDVLTPGVQIDGWGMSFNVLTPASQSFVKTGAGSFAGDPGFTSSPPMDDAFVLGPLVDSAGFNRSGFAKAALFVPYLVVPRRGVRVTNVYRLSLNADTVVSTVELGVIATSQVKGLKYARIMDVDVFGTGPDHFFWSFNAADETRCFPVDGMTNVGDFLDDPPGGGGAESAAIGGGQPSQGVGDDTGDFQLAMIVDHGDIDPSAGGFMQALGYPAAYTLVTAQTEAAAVAAATANLTAAGATTYCIAVDMDSSGTFLAFGAGLGALVD